MKAFDIYLKLDPNVVVELTLFDKFLSQKLTSFSLPDYIPLLISKFDKDLQLEKTQKIIKLIKGQKIADSSFSWPSLKELKIIVGQPKNRKSSMIIIDDVTPLPKQKKLAEYLVKHTKNIICIPGNANYPTYLINKKTNSVSIVTDKKSIISLEDVESQKLYVLHPKISKFLEPKKNTLKVKKFTNHDTLIQQTENIQSNGIIISQ